MVTHPPNHVEHQLVTRKLSRYLCSQVVKSTNDLPVQVSKAGKFKVCQAGNENDIPIIGGLAVQLVSNVEAILMNNSCQIILKEDGGFYQAILYASDGLLELSRKRKECTFLPLHALLSSVVEFSAQIFRI